MRIAELTLVNFRCFGPEGVVIPLDGLTAFVGSNGSGKTAILQALTRLFGMSAQERLLEPGDFHLPPGKSRDELSPDETLTLVIEVKLVFPELAEDGEDHGAIGECFNQMMITDEGGDPFCRVRLEGTWARGNVPQGEIEQQLFWVRSTKAEPDDEHKAGMAPYERSQIHVHYVPAARDPTKQIRHVSGTIIHRLFKALKWSDEITDSIQDASDTVEEAFGKESGLQSIEAAIKEIWTQLHDGGHYHDVKLRPVPRELEEILRQMHAVFSPGPEGEAEMLDRLSDGLKSLFYFALVSAGFRIESLVDQGHEELSKVFDADVVNAPVLTVFAVEEAENHIAPHYLGRIVKQLRALIETGRSQVLLTSHSPAIMQRIEPTEVRHVRRDHEKGHGLVNSIRLPENDTEAFKYVREAVRAYPELYFARLVVLGEGDSEEIVLPCVAEARGIPIDSSFVSVVPLGGRHVNHFWRLLHDLDVPHITLLDYDRERLGGAWGRIQYVLRELIAIGVEKNDLLAVDDGKGGTTVLSDKALREMAGWDVADEKNQKGWRKKLEKHGVFFAYPLDFDFLLLTSFPDNYEQVLDGADGPDIPDAPASAEAKPYVGVIRAVLKPKGGDGSTYNDDQKKAFFWYRYLFLGRSKPVSHIWAMASIDQKELDSACPAVLRRLCERMQEMLAAKQSDESDGD